MVRFDTILSDAMKLPPTERNRLAMRLFESLPERTYPEEPPSISPEFAAELDRRAAEAEAHPERLLDWEEVKNELLAERSRK